jgi:hypothetical protein
MESRNILLVAFGLMIYKTVYLLYQRRDGEAFDELNYSQSYKNRKLLQMRNCYMNSSPFISTYSYEEINEEKHPD